MGHRDFEYRKGQAELVNPPQLADLVGRSNSGDRTADCELFDVLYRDLRRLAAWNLRNQGNLQSLSPTGLVNETYVRLFGKSPKLDLKDRNHFLALCCRVMRRIIVDRARRRVRRKNDLSATVSLTGSEIGSNYEPETVIAIHSALDKLAAKHPRAAKVVEMRFFGGLEEADIASILSVDVRTVQRDWKLSKLLLKAALKTGSRVQVSKDGVP